MSCEVVIVVALVMSLELLLRCCGYFLVVDVLAGDVELLGML